MCGPSTYIAFVVLLAGCVYAHEVRPAYLEIRQTGVETYDGFWKVPAVGDNLRLGLHVRLPQMCAKVVESTGEFSNNAYSERWSFRCTGGLEGGSVYIDGLTATMTDVLVRISRQDGSSQITRLTPSNPSFVAEAAPSRVGVARTYVALGIEHILTGTDHLLFVSGLLLLVSGFWRVVKTISAFTLSHSVTLTLATMGLVHVPTAPVEAVIALSILFVACEVLRLPGAPLSIAQSKPWLVAFTFGLLHGLGFASGLSAAGLPTAHIPLALGFFSAGVEIGHFSFVAAVLLLFVAARRWLVKAPAWSWRVPPYAIGSVASYWLISRLATL
jgi:HupE / UreJ protein